MQPRAKELLHLGILYKSIDINFDCSGMNYMFTFEPIIAEERMELMVLVMSHVLPSLKQKAVS